MQMSYNNIRAELIRIGIAVLLFGQLFVPRSLAADTNAAPAPDPWTMGQLYARGKALDVPGREIQLGPDVYKRGWDFTQPDRGNFTFFDGVTNVQAAPEGALAFALVKKTATLGWGNYGNLQPEKERVKFWPAFLLKIKARQTGAEPVTFRIRFWESGKRDSSAPDTFDEERHTETLKGKDWQDLSFEIRLPLPRRDGFDLEITGPAGAEIQVRDLRIYRSEYQGYFRKEIYLPEGRLWRAVADVGNQAHLYINGKEVPCQDIILIRPNWFGGDMYRHEALDITEYLAPGRTNCLGLYGWRAGHAPYICLQGSAILTSGERVILDSNETWNWSREAPDGWNQAGFDDSAWVPVSADSHMTNNAIARSLEALNYKARTDRPVHDGYITLENPVDTKLFYSERDDVACHVLIPNGLDARKPILEWGLSRYDQGRVTEVKRGRESQYLYHGPSLRFTLNAGRQPHGVYLLETKLMSGAEVLDARIPEPLVVVAKIPMRPTDGETFTQDMDLELEREIDLTNPKDGPWLEADGKDRPAAPTTNTTGGVTEPSIIKRDGLTYRETRPAYGSMISYLVQFKHPGDFYVMELDYPNDMERHLGVACCPRTWGVSSQATYSKTSAAVATGDRYPVTRQMQTLQWLYRPDPGNHALDLVNLSGARVPAAGAKLRLYYIKNGLPALRAPEKHTRWNGHLTERTKEFRFSIQTNPPPEEMKDYYAMFRADGKMRPDLEMCQVLEQHLDATENYVRYMRFVGQNVHMMGCYQYSNGNTPFLPDWPFPCPRLRTDVRDVFTRVMRENNIDFYASVEFVFDTTIMDLAAKQPVRPEKGFWDTLYLVNEQGREYTEWEGHYGMNFNHPLVRGEMLRVADALAKKFQALPNCRGINWTPYFGSDWIPCYRGRNQTDLLALGYGDVTIRKFEQDTGWTLPVSLEDPQRFLKRYTYLTAEPMRAKWLAWRAETMKAFFREVADTIHRYRQDLDCVCDLYMNPVHDMEWHQSGLSFADFMLLNGWNGALFREDPNVCLAHTMYGKLNIHGNIRRYGLGWEMSSSPERFAFFGGGRNRAVQVKHDWHEVEESAWALPYREDWPRFFQLTLMEQADGYNTAEVFTRGLVGADARLFFYGFADATLFEGNEQPLREFNRALRVLPAEMFQPVDNTGLQSNFAIRELQQGEKYYVYVANPGYWPVSGTITLDQAPEVFNLVTGARVAQANRKGLAAVKVDLKPFGVAAFMAPAPVARVSAWQATPKRGLETRHLEEVVERVDQLLGTPAAVVVLRPEDETFMRAAVAVARQELARNNYAGALYAVSSDRFWTLKLEYLEKGARFGTETERSAQCSTEKRQAKVSRADSPPVIDGKLDDAVWQKAEVYSGFISPDGRSAMAGTSFQAAHDGRNLYLAFRCKDRNPKDIKMKAVRANEGTVFADDSVSMFIQPDPAVIKYYQMAVSAGGVLFDQKVVGGDRNYDFAPPWEAKTAVTDDGWVLEIKIPASSLEGKIEGGQAWGFNVFRFFRNSELPASSWSYTPGDAHTPERFGRLEFAP